MSEGVQQFGNVSLGSRSGTSQGQLKITSTGFFWKKTGTGAGKTVELPLKDIDSFVWTKVSRGCQLGIKRKSGAIVNFTGFRDQDLEQLRQVTDANNKSIEEKELSMSGRNWGEAIIDGSTLVFNVAGKPALRIPLTDVGQVQKGRDEVILEFPADDTAGGGHEDALFEMSFHIPKENDRFGTGDESTSAAEVFHDQVVQFTDAGAAAGNAVVTFDTLSLVAPRGRFDVEMYMSSLKLTGQAQDYRIQYDSIVRLFILPKTNVPQTMVVISLDPPIRKGQTYYPHILCQFNNDEELNVELDITEEQLQDKNEKCGGKLQQSFSGSAVDVFTKTLRGLAATKLTKPSAFRTADGAGYAVRCSYKADDGYLYPLERAFFYIQKPPTLLVHDEIESVEFLRQGGGMLAASAKTFDLSIRMQGDTEFQFRGIQKSEWNNLFNFIQAKRLRIENVAEAEMGPSGAARLGLDIDLGEDIDTGMASMKAAGELDDDESEDEDFDIKGKEDDEGEPTDESEAESGDAEMIDEDRPKTKKPKPTPTAMPAADSGAAKPVKKSKAKPKASPEEGNDGKGKAKKPRKKKDKNEPKRGLSAFMFYSQANREKVKQENPGIAFTDVAKALGEKWKNVTADEKKEFEEQAAKDKARYEQEMAAYKATKAEAPDSD